MSDAMSDACLWEGCDRPVVARGLCGRDYKRARAAGMLDTYGYAAGGRARGPFEPPHSSPAECPRWGDIGSGVNACPCFTIEHWRALAAAGQLPPMALALGLHDLADSSA